LGVWAYNPKRTLPKLSGGCSARGRTFWAQTRQGGFNKRQGLVRKCSALGANQRRNFKLVDLSDFHAVAHNPRAAGELSSALSMSWSGDGGANFHHESGAGPNACRIQCPDGRVSSLPGSGGAFHHVTSGTNAAKIELARRSKRIIRREVPAGRIWAQKSFATE
jgi:hypothetical protein